MHIIVLDRKSLSNTSRSTAALVFCERYIMKPTTFKGDHPSYRRANVSSPRAPASIPWGIQVSIRWKCLSVPDWIRCFDVVSSGTLLSGCWCDSYFVFASHVVECVRPPIFSLSVNPFTCYLGWRGN